MTPIENKEIRGITLKVLVAIISCTVSIIVSIMVYTNKMEMRIETMKLKQDAEYQLLEDKIKNIEKNADAVSEVIRELQKSH
jgi:peptidoglycan hydrolase CwlO-like protein